jgi:hypothetical protein
MATPGAWARTSTAIAVRDAEDTDDADAGVENVVRA